MNKIADRLHLRPTTVDGAEIAPGEIRQEVGLAISAGSKEGQRFRWEVRHWRRLRGGIDRINAPIAAKNAVETERRGAGGRRQPPHDISAIIDKAFGRHDRREFELRFLRDAASHVGVDIHQGQDRRWLRQIERNIETVAYLHMTSPCASEPRHSRELTNQFGAAFVPFAPRFCPERSLTAGRSRAQRREQTRRRRAPPFARPGDRPDRGHEDYRGAILPRAG